jgi:hypothetical protein
MACFFFVEKMATTLIIHCEMSQMTIQSDNCLQPSFGFMHSISLSGPIVHGGRAVRERQVCVSILRSQNIYTHVGLCALDQVMFQGICMLTASPDQQGTDGTGVARKPAELPLLTVKANKTKDSTATQ